MAVVFGDLPKELQDNCVLFLDPTSVGRVAQVSKACWAIADAHLDAAKAAFAAAPFEKSQHGSIRTYRNPSDGSKLITFSLIDGGQARTQRFVCSCTPNTERVVGQAFSAVVRHMASRDHWNHLAACRLRRGAADRGCMGCLSGNVARVGDPHAPPLSVEYRDVSLGRARVHAAL